ncbi:unnamed protein product [Cyprideis torosa]|uniref:DNA damage-binding protein 1 n=1 Tax=Cyprideis torosa TaxID=163714 RepID=A0A7R8W219_9CRUS|nr:unnamed protein product [Cyprideis torosa]CAG0881514.1 unnamed protein product [Cyprideis torosa]
MLLVLTSKCNAMILKCVHVPSDNGGTTIDLVTRAYGIVSERKGRPSVSGMNVFVDPDGRAIGLSIYDGLLKIIPLPIDDSLRELDVFNVRIDDQLVQDMIFLENCRVPTICFICQDSNGRHVKTLEVNLKDRDVRKGPWRQDNVDPDAGVLVAVPPPWSGVIIVGIETITYHSGSTAISIAPPALKSSSLTCFTLVSSAGPLVYILGDFGGKLYTLTLSEHVDPFDVEMATTEDDSKKIIRSLQLDYLGLANVPEALVYLGNNLLFNGSRLGDSQLLYVNAFKQGVGGSLSAAGGDRALTSVETYTSLAPITDMVVVDVDNQGQGQLVCCSGANKDGSIRIVRNGIGIEEHATIDDLPGIKGIWSARIGPVGDYDNALVMTFVRQTRVLSWTGEEVEEAPLRGFEGEQQTLLCLNVFFNKIVQVTEEAVLCLNAETAELEMQWSPPESGKINLADGNKGQIVVTSGATVYYLEIKETTGEALSFIASKKLDADVSCISINPLRTQDDTTKMVAVGSWDMDFCLLTLPDFKVIASDSLPNQVIPRGIMPIVFDGVPYLLVALGDGTLIYYVMDPSSGALSGKKRATLGTRPLSLKTFRTRGDQTNVFACSDRPSVIYSINKKLVFSSVNIKEVSYMCPLHTEAYPNSLAMATQVKFMIGTIDEIQKLHIRSIPLGETPVKIAHQSSTSSYAILTYRSDLLSPDASEPIPFGVTASSLAMSTSESRAASEKAPFPTTFFRSAAGSYPYPRVSGGEAAEEVDVHHVLIMHQNTYEITHAHRLLPNEHGLCITSTKLKDDEEYFVVGTAIVLPDETDPKDGRILVFKYDSGELQLVAEKESKGAVYAVVPFHGKVLCTIGNMVRLYDWTAEKEMRLECSHFNHVTALSLKAKGDFILVGDLMRSMTVLLYRSVESCLEEIARDYDPKWLVAVEILDDDLFLCADNFFNLAVCQKDSSSPNEDERLHMTETGLFHLGEMINVFCHGKLFMQEATEISVPIQGCVLFGTVNGAIGLCCQIPKEFSKCLFELQDKMSETLLLAGGTVGKIQHSFYRGFMTTSRRDESKGFIDGDLIESYLELDKEKQEEIAKNISLPGGTLATADELIKIVEDLAQLH